MKLDWSIDTCVDPSLTCLMQTAADVAIVCEGISPPCAVSIRLCDDEDIHKINLEYRNVDKATDVLSFPTINYPDKKTAGECPELVLREWDDDFDACFLGDIVISVPHALKQAEEYCHSPQRECAYLLVHGICHLMGYDHILDQDKPRMRKMEEKIMSEIGLAQSAYTNNDDDICNDNTLLCLAREAMTRSYSPYSHYPVGAALLCEDGRIFTGCNIENSAYGVTMCAERTALFKAVSEGAKEFTAIAIASQGSTTPWPCGACRQALFEFAPHIRILMTWGENVTEKTLDDLLPCGFGPSSLE